MTDQRTKLTTTGACGCTIELTGRAMADGATLLRHVCEDKQRTYRCSNSLRVVKPQDAKDRVPFGHAWCGECQRTVAFEMRFLGSIGYAKPFYTEHTSALPPRQS